MFAFFISIVHSISFGQTTKNLTSEGWKYADAHRNCNSCHTPHNTVSSNRFQNIPLILKKQYNTEKMPQLGKAWASLLNTNFPLCFQCHETSSVINTHRNIKNGHFMKYAGCNACHDPHSGNIAASNKYIQFDKTIIQPNLSNGKTIDLSSKKCFMVCHDPGNLINYVHSSSGSAY